MMETTNSGSTKLILQSEAVMPTPFGTFNMLAFAEDAEDRMPQLALVHPDMNPQQPVTVRIHSECITGDLFGSKRCDCGEQLEESLRVISQEKGALLYLRQEGRGIGIINKLKAYQLQDAGLDTIQANLHLGFEIDERHYDIAIDMLQALSIQRIRLLTNNPEKVEAFQGSGVDIVERVPLIIPPRKENRGYLRTKREQMGHFLDT
jgi:3,4-dihydroxy 2-butanone 4-phosphate synthase/GTP cyclohydrolase II